MISICDKVTLCLGPQCNLSNLLKCFPALFGPKFCKWIHVQPKPQVLSFDLLISSNGKYGVDIKRLTKHPNRETKGWLIGKGG